MFQNKQINRGFWGLLIMIIAVGCQQKKDPEPSAITSNTITSVAPLLGVAGDKIKIATSLPKDAKIKSVTFNGVESKPYYAVNATNFEVPVPEYSSTGKIIIETKAGVKIESEQDFVVQYPKNQLTPIGGKPRVQATGFTIGSKIYMGLGNDDNDFWQYDTQTNTWKQVADFPGGAREGAIGFTLNNKGYITTGVSKRGTDETVYYQDLWEYDPTIDRWNKKTDLPAIARHSAVGFGMMDKGYVGMGYGKNTGLQKDLWEYNPSTDQWLKKANFPEDGLSRAASFVIDHRAYVGTGNIGIKSFWEYDARADQWTRKADFAGRKRNNAVGFTIGAKGYIGLGEGEDIWEYDTTIDQWTQVADFDGGDRAWAIAFSIGNTAYIGMGWGQSRVTRRFVRKRDFWQYQPH